MWYLALVMAISLLFSVALYNVTTNELSNGLNSESQRIYNQFPVFDNDRFFDLHSQPYYDTSAHHILIKLIVFNIIVFFGAGLASYWLAKRTLEPIEAAHEQQKRFTADVSHELRTPLTAIKMESEVALLNKQAKDSELKATIKSNLEEVGKLDQLINSILRLTRLEADELQQNFSLVKTSEIIKEAKSTVEAQAKAKKQEIDILVHDGNIYGDKDSLTQLVVIILDNAIKYSPNKSHIDIKANNRDKFVSIRIKDEGRGIKPEALSNIFDRFYRADESRNKGDQEGFGLGLSIAKMIADIHGGSITITSTENKGTTVTLLLPKP